MSEWRLSVTDNEPGGVMVMVSELTAESRGQILRFELDIAEMERLHRLLTNALWYHVRAMT